jgi:hypothetical protein
MNSLIYINRTEATAQITVLYRDGQRAISHVLPDTRTIINIENAEEVVVYELSRAVIVLAYA